MSDDLFSVVEAPKPRSMTLKWLEPRLIPHDDFPTTVWDTECGRYRVGRTLSSYPGDHWAESEHFSACVAVRFQIGTRKEIANGTAKVRVTWDPVELSKSGSRKRYTGLDVSIAACEEHCRRVNDLEYVESNADDIIALATLTGQDVLPQRKIKVEKVKEPEEQKPVAVAVVGLDDVVSDDLFLEV